MKENVLGGVTKTDFINTIKIQYKLQLKIKS